MTQKDYVKIAAVLASNSQNANFRPFYGYQVWHKIVNDFVDMLKQDNPRFNAAKFIEACEK